MKNVTLDQIERWYSCLGLTRVGELWKTVCGDDAIATPAEITKLSALMPPEQLVWTVMRPEVLEDSEMLTLSAWLATEYNIVDQLDPVKMRLAAWAVVKIGAASEEELKTRWDNLNLAIFNRIKEFAA